MITLYTKNRPWSGEPRCDFIRVLSENPESARGYRIEGAQLAAEPIPDGYLRKYVGWYHPATAWEIEEFHRMAGGV
jgi:hypothetical protein